MHCQDMSRGYVQKFYIFWRSQYMLKPTPPEAFTMLPKQCYTTSSPTLHLATSPGNTSLLLEARVTSPETSRFHFPLQTGSRSLRASASHDFAFITRALSVSFPASVHNSKYKRAARTPEGPWVCTKGRLLGSSAQNMCECHVENAP